MPADQLSLFEDADAVAPTAAKAGRRKRTKGAAIVAESLDLFDTYAAHAPMAESTPYPSPCLVIATPPLALQELQELGGTVAARVTPQTEAPSYESYDPFADDAEDSADSEDDQGRVRFDPAVWQLRSESGDFIHIKTGEVREEDEFLFAVTDSEDGASATDEWDLPQVKRR